eukprot:gnl/Spiro4/18454_TR9877_c0_g1_i1.p1 gnl/Spiro4/18454_TR9877_c0_g1~~gnl/Spiro4/18454_TR9877_c0_g1_i1.p1  ORF type:complete len:188 (+),score=64.07 gnl/Spiro4/18454_TR9877_c0_g1_i1:59-565(+)
MGHGGIMFYYSQPMQPLPSQYQHGYVFKIGDNGRTAFEKWEGGVRTEVLACDTVPTTCQEPASRYRITSSDGVTMVEAEGNTQWRPILTIDEAEYRAGDLGFFASVDRAVSIGGISISTVPIPRAAQRPGVASPSEWVNDPQNHHGMRCPLDDPGGLKSPCARTSLPN